VRNWQFCDGEPYYQDGIPQLLIPLGWGPLRHLDNAPIPGTEPPKVAYRPECLPVSIWDVGGLGGKFAQSPPNPGGYNQIFKIHKGMAPFYYEMPQIIQYPFQAGRKYMFRAWVFMDFYDADGNPMDDPYGAEAGIALDGEVRWSGPLPMDQWSELTVAWTPEQDVDRVEIALCGKAQWGMAGNTFWWHGLRMYEDEDGPTPSPPPPASGVVELGPESRVFITAQIEQVIEMLRNFNPGVPAPPLEEPALWDEDLRAALPRNDSCPAPLQSGWWQRTLSQITGITLHHTIGVSPLATTQAYLQKDGGRPSIPYHFWVHRDGQVSYCLDLTEGCWHDHTGYKNKHVSVGLAGVLDEDPPTQAQLQAVIRLTRRLMAGLGISVAGVKGHRDFMATRCPGWGAPPNYLPWRAEFYAGIGESPPPAPNEPTLIGFNDEAGDEDRTGADWMRERGLRGLIVRPFYIRTHAQMLDFSAEEDAGLRVIVNLRYSFARDNGGQGTLPLPGTPAGALFVEAAAQTMVSSWGVWGWEIGNEYNNPREFPVTGALTPEAVVEIYNAIRARVWESTVRPRMAPGSLDPFNAQAGDPRDWLNAIWGQIEGAEFVTAHGYVRGPDPALVRSPARFADDPLRWQYLNYPGCITELLKELPCRWDALPVYVTEFNHLWKTAEGDWGWVDDERAAEIIRRAHRAAQEEHLAGVALYRWAGDAWQVQHNQAVLSAVAEILT